MNGKNPVKKRHLAKPLQDNRVKITGFIFLLLSISFLLHWGNTYNHDEGAVLNAAWKMQSGQSLYSDFFEYIAPLSFYLVFFVFKIFGPLYWPVNLISILLAALSAYWFFRIFLFLTKRPAWAVGAAWAWLLAAGSAYPAINHNTYATALSLAALYAFVLHLEKNRPAWLYLSGFLSGAVFLVLQTKGLALIIWFLAASYYSAGHKPASRRIWPFSLIALATPLVLLFGIWGWAPLTNLLVISRSYVAANPSGYFYIIFFFLLLGAIYWLLRRKHSQNRPLLDFLFLLQLLLYLSALNQPDLPHLMVNSYVLLMFLVLAFLGPVERRLDRVSKRVLLLVVLLLYASVLAVKAADSAVRSAHGRQAVNRLAGVVGDKGVFVYPFAPGLYFSLGKDNPYISSVPETMRVKELRGANLGILRREDPAYIIDNRQGLTQFDLEPNAIDAYIEANYQPVGKSGDVVVWGREGVE